MNRPSITAAVAATAALALAPTASADFRVGVDANINDQTANVSVLAPLVKATGSTIYRIQERWAAIAPTRPRNSANPADPAYRWAPIDAADRNAAASGAQLLINIYAAPSWAEGPNRPTTGYGKTNTLPPITGSWDPDPAALGQFATAMATRYSGTTPDPLNPGAMLPRVSLYEAWNEPNYKMFLTPQCSVGRLLPAGNCSRHGVLVSIDKYRAMLNAFYSGVKLVQPEAIVSSAGLASSNASSQGSEIAPLRFLRGLLCVTPGTDPGSLLAMSDADCPVKATLDAVAYHPYTLFGRPTSSSPVPDGLVLGNTPQLSAIVASAVDQGTVLPAGPKQLWASELDWLTCPPCARTASGRVRGLTPARAAAYTSETIYRLWSWGVSKFTWYSMVDEPSWPAAGLYYGGATLADATAKPSLASFSFPTFSAMSGSTPGSAFAWAMSPCRAPDATVTFETRSSFRWVTVATGSPDADGVIKTDDWVIPRHTTAVRATASGTGCTTTLSTPVAIAAS
jgi:hypothetical protein